MSKLSNSFPVLALAVAATALMATVSGCSGDDYYCDANGCYYCDGVGCRAAVPPSRTPCRGDYECPTGQLCTNLGCVVSCGSDADCARGWICRGASAGTRGTCVAPAEATPVRNPGACRTNTDCTGGTVCVDGSCARPVCGGATASCACTTNEQCTGGQVCVGGRCTAPSNTCQFSAQCGPGRVCVNQQCLTDCSMGQACPTGQMCRDGICADRPAGECTRDADCGTTRRCVNATCYARCTSSAQCGAGLYCNDQSVCAPDTRRQPICRTDADCERGSRCLDGLCRVPCTSAEQCQRTDISYRNCASIAYLRTAESYCQTDREFRPSCARASDCAAGQSCVDALCRNH